MAPTSLSTGPIANVALPKTSLVPKAMEYIQIHLSPSFVHHVVRSSFYALIIAGKTRGASQYDPETLVVATLLHDLGWSHTLELISSDKRFEVDGAIAAVNFILAETSSAGGATEKAAWDSHRLQRVWDAIALHTTPSIAPFKEPEVACACLGIMADFWGPHLPGGLITVDEYQAVVGAYPRLGFKDAVNDIMCDLCANNPETTYDNFVGEFGCRGVEGYKEKWEKHRLFDILNASLSACEQFEN